MKGLIPLLMFCVAFVALYGGRDRLRMVTEEPSGSSRRPERIDRIPFDLPSGIVKPFPETGGLSKWGAPLQRDRTFRTEELDACSRFIVQSLRETGIPGAAFTLVQRSETLLSETFGSCDNSATNPVDSGTLFSFGDCTAGLTGLLAIRLRYLEQVDLDSPIPRFRMTDPDAARQVTIRMLLSESAGIPSYVDEILEPAWATPVDIFEVIAQAPVLATPGKLYERSRISIAAGGYLLAMAASRETGLLDQFEEAMRTMVFDPLSMKTATFSPEIAFATGNYARGFVAEPTGGYRGANGSEPRSDPFAPASGLKASLQDTIAWLTVESNWGVLSDETVFATHGAFLRRWYGSGASRTPERSFGWHRQLRDSTEMLLLSGQSNGQTVSICLFPAHNAGCGILINAESADAEAIARQFYLSIAELLES